RANMAFAPGTAHAAGGYEFGTVMTPPLIVYFVSTLLSIDPAGLIIPMLQVSHDISLVRPKFKVPPYSVPIVLLEMTAFSGVPLSVVTAALFILKRVPPEELWNNS